MISVRSNDSYASRDLVERKRTERKRKEAKSRSAVKSRRHFVHRIRSINRDKAPRAGEHQNVIDGVLPAAYAREDIDDDARPQVRRVFQKITAAFAPPEFLLLTGSIAQCVQCQGQLFHCLHHFSRGT